VVYTACYRQMRLDLGGMKVDYKIGSHLKVVPEDSGNTNAIL